MAALLSASPVTAACWSETAYEAARIRHFETRMMVSMLRCRLKGIDFTQAYNGFVRGQRDELSLANRQLQSAFAAMVGAGRAMGAYDDYMTKLANGFGAGDSGVGCGQAAEIAQQAAQPGVTRAALIDMAEKAGPGPQLPLLRCGVDVAHAPVHGVTE